MTPFSPSSRVGIKIMALIQHYDHEKYWRRRSIVIDPNAKCCLLKKLYYLLYIKRCDAYNNCSFGTNLNAGAQFATPPELPHGPNGIIVGHDVVVGANCIICQQVTIMHGGGCRIGDNVLIGAGAKILGYARIGNNCKIGSNCVVFENIPDNATCVLPKPRIILKEQ